MKILIVNKTKFKITTNKINKFIYLSKIIKNNVKYNI